MEDDAHKPRYIETIRKRGYRLVAPVAWSSERTDVDSAAPASHAGTPQTMRSLRSRTSQMIGLLLVGALAVTVVFMALRDDPAPSEASVAVLPFTNMSADNSDEHYADGITEVLIHQLSQVPGLQVIARTSSFTFKGENPDARTVGELLNVAAVLEGSVQRSNGKIRITAQLIDTRTGTHYWSRLYDREDTDVFAVQDEIAASVVDALASALLSDRQTPVTVSIGTKNIDAYDEYLKGLQQLAIASHESLPRAVAHFRSALELDDDYNEARLALADTYNAMLRTFQITYAELINWNESIPREVLQRDPESALAMSYLARADFSRNFSTGSGAAARLYARAIELAPNNPRILWNYADYLGWNDRSDEAIVQLEKALKVDPLSAVVLTSYAAGAGSLHYAERLQDVHPQNPAGWSIAAEIHLARGELAAAYRHFLMAETKDPQNAEFPAYVAMVLMTVGLLDEAAEALQRAEAKGPGAPLTIAANIALTYRQGRLETAGEMSLGNLLAASPPRRFGVLVQKSAALEYALRTNQAERFLAAFKAAHDAPGYGGMNLRDPVVESLTGYTAKLSSVPALRAVGENDLADRILASGRAYFDNASEAFKYHETAFELDLFAGNYDAALDTLETLIESSRAGGRPSNFSSLSEFRWWLEFEGERAEPLRAYPRYQRILDKREEKLAAQREAILMAIAGN